MASNRWFQIWATVDGRAGHREAWLKYKDGPEPMRFEWAESAYAMCRKLSLENNKSLSVRFTYEVREMTDSDVTKEGI
jgi:hypothetical protein